jgi:hypothetical protein
LRLHRKFGLLVGFPSAVLAIGVTSAHAPVISDQGAN